MKTLSRNKVLVALMALLMAVCAMLGILATAPRSVSADEVSTNGSGVEIKFNETSIESNEYGQEALEEGRLYRIRKDGIFTSDEKIPLLIDGFTFADINLGTGYVEYYCESTDCGNRSRVSKIINIAEDYSYVDVSMPGSFRCICGKNTDLKSRSYLYPNSDYTPYCLVPDVDTTGLTFVSAKEVSGGGVWVKMNYNEFNKDAENGWFINCTILDDEGNEIDLALRVVISDVFCIFVDTYRYVEYFNKTDLPPITQYVAATDCVMFYVPEEYTSFDIIEKVSGDAGEFGDNTGGNEDETPGDEAEDENSSGIGEWIDGVGDKISGWLNDKTGLAISGSVVVIVLIILIVLAFRKRR